MKRAVDKAKEEGEVLRHRKWQDRDFADKTVADYKRDWEAIKDATGVEHIKDLREDTFLDLCESLIGRHHESRLEKYRGAVKQEQIARLIEPLQWYKTERFRLRFSGMVKEAAERFRKEKSQKARENGAKSQDEPDDPDDGQRGAIQLEKAIQVVGHFQNKGQTEYARGAAVTYAGAFRHEEIAEATLADVKREPDGRFYIRVTGGKGRRENEVEWVWIEGIDQTMTEIFNEKETRAHGLLFPHWKEDIAIEGVKWCAREYGWEPNRRWDWHCFRHGRAVDWREAGMPQEERMRRGRWRDSRTEEWYSRPR